MYIHGKLNLSEGTDTYFFYITLKQYFHTKSIFQSKIEEIVDWLSERPLDSYWMSEMSRTQSLIMCRLALVNKFLFAIWLMFWSQDLLFSCFLTVFVFMANVTCSKRLNELVVTVLSFSPFKAGCICDFVMIFKLFPTRRSYVRLYVMYFCVLERRFIH